MIYRLSWEIRKIIDDCYVEAAKLLTENEEKLHVMADALMDYETLNADQLDDIMAGAKPRLPVDEDPSSKGEKPGPEGEKPIGGPAPEG